MKNSVRATACIAFLLFGGWALTTRATAFQEKKIKEQDAKKPAIRDSYLKNCARCHDADGKSQSERGQALEAADLTSREVRKMSRKSVVKVIAEGEGKMPAFDKKLSAAEIKSLAKYIRSL